MTRDEIIAVVEVSSSRRLRITFADGVTQSVDVAAMENAGVPVPVRDLVVRCTAKKPEDRPQTFQAIVEELPGRMMRTSASPPVACRIRVS